MIILFDSKLRINIKEFIDIVVVRSLYIANNHLTPKFLGQMAIEDFDIQWGKLKTSKNDRDIMVSIHNIYAMSVSLGLQKLVDVIDELQSQFKEKTDIQTVELEYLMEIATKSFDELCSIDESEWHES